MTKVRKTLGTFRLAIAQSILRNEVNTILIQSDMHNMQHVIELCDQYSLQMLANWLATKYGFPVYTSAIEKQSSNQWVTLDRWPFLSSEYPFAMDRAIQMPKRTIQEVFGILENGLSSSLELLGTLYEEITGAPLVINKNGQPYIKKGKNRRFLGQFYTPFWLVGYCLDRALTEDSESLMREIKAVQITNCVGSVCNEYPFHMLDPACGTGNFLIGAVEWLKGKGLSESELVQFVLEALYGIEVDGRAASLTRVALLLCLSQSINKIAVSTGCQSTDNMLAVWLVALQRHIIVCDSLFAVGSDTTEQKSQNTLSLKPDFSQDYLWQMNCVSAFDLVASNPPYVSFGSRNQVKPPSSLIKYFKKNYPHSTEYKIRLNSIFQEIALRYARLGGQVVLLVPDAFLAGCYYEKLRKKILKDARICSITEFADNVIDQATVGRWCVANYRRQSDVKAHSYEVALYSCFEEYGTYLQFDEQVSMEPHLRKSYMIPVDLLVSKDRHRFQLLFCDQDKAIWTRLADLENVGKLLSGHTGIRCRSGQKSIVSKVKAGSFFERGIVSGAQVTRHRIVWDGSWLNVNPALLFAGGFDSYVIKQPKLLLRQTADKVIAAVDDNGFYHLNNVHSFIPIAQSSTKDDAVDLYFFDGLFNSTFWQYLYQLKTRESGRALAQIDIEMIESMPLPKFSEPKVKYVSQLVKSFSMIGQAGQGEERLFLLKVDRAIDWLVYDLYNLTDEEVIHIENLMLSDSPAQGCLPKKSEVIDLVDVLSKNNRQASEK